MKNPLPRPSNAPTAMAVVTRRKLLGAALASSLLATAGPAHAESTKDLLDEVARARATLKTLVATFRQRRVIGLLAQPVDSKGELTIVRPDRLRWELFAPDSVVYWVGPEGVAVKSGSSGKVTKAGPEAGGFGAVLGDLLAFLGGDLAKLEERYAITAKREGDGAIGVVAVPKTDAVKRLVGRIELRTNPEKWGVSRIVLEEPSGDSSTVDFDANQRDVKVDPARMRPPA